MNLIRIMMLLGIPGAYLYACKRLKRKPRSCSIPVFGRITTLHEVRNIFDNFGAEAELRDPAVERYLAGREAPVVVDCGVNVGVTVRWWLHLNHRARVYGVDMMEEAHAYTVEAVRSAGGLPESYTPVLAALWSEEGRRFTIGIGDPLCGDYGYFRKDIERTERTFVTVTLDDALAPHRIAAIDLLKVDLEAAGADALKAAHRTLELTRHVVFECHGDAERQAASGILVSHGFVLRRSKGRHLWWEKKR